MTCHAIKEPAFDSLQNTRDLVGGLLDQLRDIALQQQHRLPQDSDIQRHFNPDLIHIARVGVQTSDHASDVSSALPRLLREAKSKFWQQHVAQRGHRLFYDGAWHEEV